MKRSQSLFVFVALLCLFSPVSVLADEDAEYFKPKILELEERVKELEAEKRKRGAPKNRFSKGSTTATGISRAFNPAISVNGLLLGTYVDEGRDDGTREVKTGLDIQELELVLEASVDTYFHSKLVLAMEEVDAIEIEEFITEVLLLNNLSLRAGKFFAPFGKHNLLHTHAFPFVDAPLINEEILGEEGINEIGVGLAYLLPTPWFSDIQFQFLEGENEGLFNGPLNDDFLYLVHLKNLVDLTPDLTAELGGSFAYGRNDLVNGPYNHTELAGVDVTFKWKPGGREKYRSLTWMTEFINSSRDIDKKGMYTLLQYQFARKWWVQGRYDFFTIPRDQVGGGGEVAQDKNRYSALLAHVFSEFSVLRLQYNYLNQLEADEHQVFLQLNFTFGSHPPHSY